MTDENANTHSEDDDGEESPADLKQRVKEYVLATIAWLRAQLAQSASEIALQLRGAVAGVSIPKRAVKPLAVAGVLLVGAIALGPAAPFDGGDTNIETQEPVEGETYEPVADTPTLGGSTLNTLPSSYLGAGEAEAPDPPREIRASAGSQTMSVETAVVDGEPAIVLEDDRTHEGRWVSIETAWLKEHIGEVPSAAYIDHEEHGEYAAPLQVQGDSAAFYVREFSTNTVTFDGEVTLSGAEAGDGTEYQYELDTIEGVEDPSINLTGVENTAPKSASKIVSGSDSINIDVGGTTDPKDGKITLTGTHASETKTYSGSGSDGVTSESIAVDGNVDPTIDADLTGSQLTDDYSHGGDHYSIGEGEEVTITVSSWDVDTVDEIDVVWNYMSADHRMQVEVDGVDMGTHEVTDTTCVTCNDHVAYTYDKNTVDNVGSSIELTLRSVEITDGTGSIYWGTDDKYGYDAKWYSGVPDSITASTDDGGSESVSLGSNSLSATTDTSDVTFDWSGGGKLEYDLSYDDTTETRDPEVTVGGKTVSHSGVLADGETITESVDLSTGQKTADVSTGGEVNAEIGWTEVSETVDPVVEVNGHETGVDGTLADGETVSLATNASWLQEGTNRVNVSTNSPTSGPASLVGLEYSHGAETTTSATVEETTWSQTTTVSNTWAAARSNGTATLPMNDRVVDVRNVEIRENDTTWEPVAERDYTLNGTDLTVQLGDVAEGSTTEVRATGSKVRVEDGAITVLDPTTTSDTLDTRVRVDDAGPNFALSTGSTVFGERVHYAENATWGETTGDTTITADGGQTVTLPDAIPGAEATVRTWPIEVAVAQDQMTVGELAGDRSEPGLAVEGDGNAEVEYTFVGATSGQPYILYSETNGIVRDEGFAESPITLVDDNSEETLVFQVDDGIAGSGSGSNSATGGGGGPMVDAGGSVLGQLQGLVPSGQTALLGIALLGGLFVVGRRTGVVTEERTDAATSAASSAAGTAGGLVERILANEIVFGLLILGGTAGVLMSGILSEQATLIVALGAVPVALFLVLQQFDAFDFRVWVGSTALVGVLGIQALAPQLGETIVEETGVILVVGVIALGWRALSAWRADANTPDNVTNLEVTAQEDDDA